MNEDRALNRREFLAATTALAGCWPSLGRAHAQPSGTADVIFRGGPILTMNKNRPRAQAVAVRGQRILAVGAFADVEARRDSRTRIVDLGGRALLPGFIDAHMHFSSVVYEDWVDLSAQQAPTFEAVLARLRDAGQRAKPGDWVRAKGYDRNFVRNPRPITRAELDAVVPDKPVFVFDSTGHVAYVNSVALRLAGVTRDTPDPETSRFVRDSKGELTGQLEESEAYLPFERVMPKAPREEMARRTRAMMDRAAAAGCTALHDCSIGAYAETGDIAFLQSVMRDAPPVRYRGQLISTLMDEWEKLGVKPGQGDDMFRIWGIKAWSDGAGQVRTAYQRQNYLNTNTRGALNYTLAQLTETIGRAHRAGWQLGVHANGDAAIDTVLQAYETVLLKSPRADHRHRIEHCSNMHPDQIAKMRKLGLSPSFLIGHIYYWGKLFRDDILGPDRIRYYDPCATALKAGLRISLHSDYDVTPLEPLRMVENAVTRLIKDSNEVFVPEERIPVEAALRAVTIDAAWQCRMEQITGSLDPGKYADFAVLERDPTRVNPTEIRKIKVSETWLAGERRHGS